MWQGGVDNAKKNMNRVRKLEAPKTNCANYTILPKAIQPAISVSNYAA